MITTPTKLTHRPHNLIGPPSPLSHLRRSYRVQECKVCLSRRDQYLPVQVSDISGETFLEMKASSLTRWSAESVCQTLRPFGVDIHATHWHWDFQDHLSIHVRQPHIESQKLLWLLRSHICPSQKFVNEANVCCHSWYNLWCLSARGPLVHNPHGRCSAQVCYWNSGYDPCISL